MSGCASPPGVPPDCLTERQRQVLKMRAEGYEVGYIALTLGTSKHTIWNHLRDVQDRLHIFTLVELVHYAIRTGLVEI